MSTPLPEELSALERALQASTARPADDLRARVLAAARANANVSPIGAARSARAPTQRRWLLGSAAAAALLLLNLARSSTLALPEHRAAPSAALCARLQDGAAAQLARLNPSLQRACADFPIAATKE